MEQIIWHQRHQYLGCIPFILAEMHTLNIQDSLKDKQTTLVSLQNAQKHEFSSKLLKEQVANELELLNELKQTLEGNMEDSASRIIAWYKERNTYQVKVLD